MSGNFPRQLLILSLLLVGALYLVKWERGNKVAQFSDPIAVLLDDYQNPGERGFSGRRARFCKILTILDDARDDHLLPHLVVIQAASDLGLDEEDGRLLADSIVENLAIADRSGLLEGENFGLMTNGELPKISAGAFAGDEIEFDFIVNVNHAPELETHFANMMLRPAFMTTDFGAPVTEDSYEKAGHFYRANLISQSSYLRLGAEYAANTPR